jgi:rare lipoprotein A
MRGDISAMHKHYYTLAHTPPLALPCALLVFTLAGCHHQTQTAYQPPPPPLHRTPSSQPEIAQAPRQPIEGPRSKPILIETGLASWYGPNYHHKAAADGSVFDQNEMTAAHRTLPLGTIVRVTNLATGDQVVVRITDRGPFAPGRVLDLSMGAAKAVGIYRAGVAKVRVEAFANPTADPAGKWAVQTGAFTTEQDALDLKDALIKRYRTARVSEFHGPTGYWVRIDPADHARPQAEAMLDWIGKPDAAALPYLVRID